MFGSFSKVPQSGAASSFPSVFCQEGNSEGQEKNPIILLSPASHARLQVNKWGRNRRQVSSARFSINPGRLDIN